jgi:hypothetical protein
VRLAMWLPHPCAGKRVRPIWVLCLAIGAFALRSCTAQWFCSRARIGRSAPVVRERWAVDGRTRRSFAWRCKLAWSNVSRRQGCSTVHHTETPRAKRAPESPIHSVPFAPKLGLSSFACVAPLYSGQRTCSCWAAQGPGNLPRRLCVHHHGRDRLLTSRSVARCVLDTAVTYRILAATPLGVVTARSHVLTTG